MTSSIPYTVFRKSRDYLYGWNWRHDKTGEEGHGYPTRKAAVAAAMQHHMDPGADLRRYLRKQS